MTATPNDVLLTPAEVAIRFRGVQPHHIRRLTDRGKIAFVRYGVSRAFRPADLSAIEAALREAGYVQDAPEYARG